MLRRRLRRVWPALFAALVATLVALIVPAWLAYRKTPPSVAVLAPAPAAAAAAARPNLPPPPATTRPPARPPARLVLVAARGDCWLRVRAGSPDGRVVWEGLLARGARRTLTGTRLVLLAGAPQNLDVVRAGRRRPLAGGSSLWVAARGALRPLPAAQ